MSSELYIYIAASYW